MNATGIAQRLDAPVVGNHVAELDDFGDAAVMFDEASGAAKGLPREVVDGNLPVVEIGIGNAGQILEDQILDDAEILADGGGADLLVVADDENGFAEVQGDEGHDVALAGFVDDDDIEAGEARIEIFYHTGEWHNPHGHGAAALGHLSRGFRTQERDADAVALADTTDGVEPADESLTLVRRSTARLASPGAAVDEVDGDAAEMLTKLFDFGLQSFQGNTGAAVEFVVELTPDPGGGRIVRVLAAAMH